MKQALRSWLWSALFLLLLWVPASHGQLPSEIIPSASMPAIRVHPQQLVQAEASNPQLKSLFYRKPWAFDLVTFESVGNDLKKILPWFTSNIQRLQQKDLSLSDYLWAAGIFFVLLMFLSARLLDRYFKQLFNPVLTLLPQTWPTALYHLVRISVAILSHSMLFLGALFLTHLIWGSFSPQSLIFPALIQVLWITVFYRSIHLLCFELLANPAYVFFSEDIRPIALQFYQRIRLFLVYSALFLGIIAVLEKTNYRSDLVDFLYFVFSGCLLLFSAYLITNKNNIFGLLPEIDEPIYQKFIHLLKRFYSWAMLYTLALGILWIVGYHNLAKIFFLRSWVLIALFLGFALFHRWQEVQIKAYFQQDNDSEHLVKQISLAIWLIEIYLVSHFFLELLGVRTSMIDWLGNPIISIGQSSLSVLSIFNGALTIVIFWLSSRITNAFLEVRVFPRLAYDTSVQQMITVSIFYLSMALGLLLGMTIMGLDLSMFAIFAGALAFGIGFGLQGIAKNFASGIILIFTGLVKKGDFITVGEYTGYIQQVSWKKVHLRTTDHVDLIVPTVSLVESTIVNWTYSGKFVRVHLPVGVAYGSDLEKVNTALLEAAAEHPNVLNDPAPTIWLKEFADSSLNFELLVWIDYETITLDALRGEINFMILRSLQRHQIEIPFPQRDLHLRTGWPPKSA
jgi:small-conductance mechanosensitive channel